MSDLQEELNNTRPDPQQLENTLLAIRGIASDGKNGLGVSDRYVLANALQYLQWLLKATLAAEHHMKMHEKVNEALSKIHEKMMTTGVGAGLVLVSNGGEVKEVTEEMAKDIVNSDEVPDEVKEKARQFLEQIAAIKDSEAPQPLPKAPDGSTLQ